MSKKTPTKKKMSAEERAAKEKERKRKYAERKKAEQGSTPTKKSTKKATPKPEPKSKPRTEKTAKTTGRTNLPGPPQDDEYRKLFLEVNSKGSAKVPVKKGQDISVLVSRINSAWRRAVKSGRLVISGGSRIRVLRCGDHVTLLKV